MNAKSLNAVFFLFAFILPVNPASADVQSRFDYGCEPRASFCSELTCTFDGSASTSSDGDITGYRWYFRRYLAEDRESETATRTGVRVTHTYTATRCRSYTWSLGDGNTGTGITVPHTYAASGTYTVFLTAADNEGATTLKSMSVTVASEPIPPAPGFNLTTTGTLARGGKQVVLLDWTGAATDFVEIYRNGVLLGITADSGTYIDNIGARGRATYLYLVCEEASSICSNEATVVFQ